MSSVNFSLFLLVVLMAVIGAVMCETTTQGQERKYQHMYAEIIQGETEVVLKDGTRADIVTDTHVFEVDWMDKWAEGLGQALHYATVTGKRAGLILLCKKLDNIDKVCYIYAIKDKYKLDLTVRVLYVGKD